MKVSCGTPASTILSWNTWGIALYGTYHLAPEVFPIDHGRWGARHNGKYVAFKTTVEDTRTPAFERFVHHTTLSNKPVHE